MARVSAARNAAFEILFAIERGGGYHSDELLRGKAVDALAPADRNLTTALVLGVLRCQIALDRMIHRLLKRPNRKLDPETMIALRLGAFQLLHLDRVPAHAAINESVELAKYCGNPFAASMVNAVLHRLKYMRGEDSDVCGGRDPLLAYPAWMVERWERTYGSEAARTICANGQTQPKLAVRLAEPSTENELARAGIELAPGSLLTAARTVIAGDVTATEAFRSGRVRIQDEGSQLIGEIAACAAGETRAQKILDACAAPGGKTLILMERIPEARVLACEVSPRRLAALRERLKALAARIEFWETDAAALEFESVFDLALIDAPCSGTGTLGRNPEIRHRLRPADLSRHAERQRSILLSALRAVRHGGRVIYSTCSIEPEENEEVAASALSESSKARQIPIRDCIEAMRLGGIFTGAAADHLAGCVTPEGALRLLPGAFGTDGFYVAVMEKA